MIPLLLSILNQSSLLLRYSTFSFEKKCVYVYELPTESKYKKLYTISKCYCSLVRPGLENKGKVWLRKQACMDENCPECCRGAFFECKDPTGLCGPWVECRLIQKSPCRVKQPAKENGGLGPKILVLSKLEVIFN